MKFHNLHEIDAANVMYNLIIEVNNILSMDEVQQLRYLPLYFDYKMF